MIDERGRGVLTKRGSMIGGDPGARMQKHTSIISTIQLVRSRVSDLENLLDRVTGPRPIAEDGAIKELEKHREIPLAEFLEVTSDQLEAIASRLLVVREGLEKNLF